MQNKTTLQTQNEIFTANEPWHRGSGFTWMLLALAGLVLFLSGAVAKAGSGFFGDGTGAAIFYGTDGNTAGEGTYRNVSNLDEFDYGDFVVSSGSLILHGGEIKTYKNGGSNVTGGNLNYRIYKNGSSGGSYTAVGLPWSADLGNGDQRWKKTDQDANLLNGLTSSGRYTVEYYFSAGSSDGTHYMSNGGGNYQTYFDLNYEITTTGSVNQNVSGGATALDGDGTFVKKGSGTVTLNNANSGFSGAVYIDAGTLAIASGATAGSNSINVGPAGSSGTATISISDSDGGTTASNQINIRQGGGTRTIHGANTSGSNTFSGAVYLDSNVTLSSASGGTLNLSGTLNDGATDSGSFAATISAGKVEFSGNGSNTGLTGYTVNNGAELRLNKTSADAIQSNLTVNSGGTATLVAANQLGSGVVVNNSGTLATGNNNDSFATLNSSGDVTGSGTLTATTYTLSGGTVSANLGAGTLNVTGDTALNGTSAATTVAVSGSGTDFNLGSGANRLSSSADVTVANGSRLNLTSSQTLSTLKEAGSSNGGTADIGSGATLTVNGANKGTNYMNSISGAGGLTMSGSGSELNLYGTQGYTGKTTVTAGTLATQVALASTDLEASGGTLESKGADKFADGATITVSGGTLKTGGNDIITRLNATSGTLDLSGDTLTVTGTGGNASSVGSGVTATGGTISVSGTLDYQSTTGSTALSIASGGKLTGSGTTSGSLSVAGTLALGNSPGTLNVGATSFLGGGNYEWEINDFVGGTQGTNWDFLNVTGALTISATSGNEFLIDVIGLLPGSNDFVFTNNYSFAIATASGGISGFDVTDFIIRTNNFGNAMTASGYNSGSWSISLANSDKDLVLSYTGATLNNVGGASAIPEPSSASMLVLGLAAVLAKRRRVTRG